LINWILHLGKKPKKAEEYAKETTRQRSCRIDQFYRRIWETEGGYTLKSTPTAAEKSSKELAYSDYSNTRKAGVVLCFTSIAPDWAGLEPRFNRF